MTLTPLERIAKLSKHGESTGNPKTQKIQKVAVSTGKVDRRHFNKRTPGSGRQPAEEQRRAQYQLVRQFADKKVPVNEVDKRTGRTRIVQMTVLEVTLATLFGEVQKKEGWAVKEMLDRILGKAAQPVVGDEDNPIILKVDF